MNREERDELIHARAMVSLTKSTPAEIAAMAEALPECILRTDMLAFATRLAGYHLIVAIYGEE